MIHTVLDSGASPKREVGGWNHVIFILCALKLNRVCDMDVSMVIIEFFFLWSVVKITRHKL